MATERAGRGQDTNPDRDRQQDPPGTAHLSYTASVAREVPWRTAQPRRYFQTATGSDTATIASAHTNERLT